MPEASLKYRGEGVRHLDIRLQHTNAEIQHNVPLSSKSSFHTRACLTLKGTPIAPEAAAALQGGQCGRQHQENYRHGEPCSLSVLRGTRVQRARRSGMTADDVNRCRRKSTRVYSVVYLSSTPTATRFDDIHYAPRVPIQHRLELTVERTKFSLDEQGRANRTFSNFLLLCCLGPIGVSCAHPSSAHRNTTQNQSAMPPGGYGVDDTTSRWPCRQFPFLMEQPKQSTDGS